MFFKLKTSEEVLELLKAFGPSGEEGISIENAHGRVLSRDIIAQENLPDYRKSTMDGYAVRAVDTFGATESIPALLEVVGEVITGKAPEVKCDKGQAVKISTGGMLPEGADGVVMVEYSSLLDEKTIEVSRSISPLENVIQPGDDFKKDALVLRKGSRLRPQDLGLMAGLGICSVPVFRRSRIGIISTGDEVIPIDRKPKLAQVRDVNRYTLTSFCARHHADPFVIGLCHDNFEQLRRMVELGLKEADSIWISGGSSVGTRDLTLKVFESFDETELLVHGISISPGKPTIIARIGSKAVFGLPGHTASAMVVAQVFLPDFLARISGESEKAPPWTNLVEAELSRNIESASGRDDYIRVRLSHMKGRLVAEPIFGKSGLISTLVEADGLVKVGRNTEGLYEGQRIKVMLFDTMRGGFN
ncbi:MAG: molybdopterin molybdotransferase MoeA [Deltaproteobacteria bacterium]|nr:molybdopterin molybdotransferase MoeA [Deltaproteobacteria bacterium]